MARGGGDRGAGALADAEEDEGLAQAGGVDHRLQVADPRFQRKFANLPIAQAAAALVVAPVAVVPGEEAQPVAPDRTAGVMVEVGQRTEERRVGQKVVSRVRSGWAAVISETKTRTQR